MPTISIIVPAYNAELTLRKCIDSILSNTFKDFELLLINDGSADNTGKICDEYEKNDKRIHVFHQKNGGVSSARNLGLENARGLWLTFVDADDWVSEEYLSNLFSKTKEDVELIMSYYCVYSNKGKLNEYIYNERIVTDENFDISFVENNLYACTAPWGKLYKKQIIEALNLRFTYNMHVGEDALFFFTYLLNINSFYIMNKADYKYCFDVENSLTKRVYALESELMGYNNITEVIEKMICLKKMKNPLSLEKLNWLRGYYVRRVLNALYYNKSISFNKRLNVIATLPLSYYCVLVSNESSSYKEKLLARLLELKYYILYDWIRIISIFFKKNDKN